MSNNRHLIDDLAIIGIPQLLDRGFFGLGGHYVVEEGRRAVLTEGGAFKEILEPGHHYLDRYSWRRDIKAIAVDCREQTLTVSTAREFTIMLSAAQPVPLKADLDLAVSYRVSDPRRVSLEVTEPVLKLYDRVLQSVREVMVHCYYQEVYVRHEELATIALQRLQAMRLEQQLGIQVLGVSVIRIEVGDAGNDKIAQAMLAAVLATEDAKTKNTIAGITRPTWSWLLLNQPAIAQQYLQIYGNLAQQAFERGLDPSSALLTPTSGTGQAGFGTMNLGVGFPQGMLAAGQPQVGQAPPQLSAPDALDRLREDKRMVEVGVPGATVEIRALSDASGVPDGSYQVKAEFPRASGGTIALFITCPRGYPSTQAAPLVEAQVDGEPVPYQPAIVRRWTEHNYLVEIAREAKQHFG